MTECGSISYPVRHTNLFLCLVYNLLYNNVFVSSQTVCMEPMGLSAARRATAKVAYVTGRQELVSNSLPKSPASSRLSHKQVKD